MKNKDDIRFEHIYSEYKDAVLRIAVMYLKDYHLAEDAAQETFCRVLRKHRTLRDESKTKAWVTSIAVNVCRDKLKHKSRREIPTEDSALDAPTSDDIDSRLAVTQAISRLSVELREVVILYYYQQLNQRETAELLGVPETTVTYRLHTAREQLKEYLKEDDYE